MTRCGGGPVDAWQNGLMNQEKLRKLKKLEIGYA